MKSLVLIILTSFIFELSFSQNSDSAQLYFKKGVEANAGRLYGVAASHFDKAIYFNPNFTDAYIENGKTDLSMRMIGKAYQNFSKAYELDPKNNEVISQLATLSFNNHQFQKAIDFAQKCLNCDNTSRILGMSFFQLEDYGKAEKYLLDALKNNGQDADAAYTLAQTYLELENEKGAITQFEKAVQLEPRNQWMYELGLVFYDQNNYQNALKYFQQAADHGFNKTNDFYENYGFAQIYAGDKENGLKTLQIILDRKPNNKELIKNIAYAFYDTKNYNEALDYFTKILNLDAKDATTLYMAGLTFQKLGQKEKGQKICDKAIEADPSLKMYRQKNELPMGL